MVVVFQGTSNPTCSPSPYLRIPFPPPPILPLVILFPPHWKTVLGNVVGFLSRIRPTKFPPFPSPLEERLEPDSFSVSYYLDSIEKVGPRIWKWGRGRGGKRRRTSMILRGFPRRSLKLPMHILPNVTRSRWISRGSRPSSRDRHNFNRFVFCVRFAYASPSSLVQGN